LKRAAKKTLQAIADLRDSIKSKDTQRIGEATERLREAVRRLREAQRRGVATATEEGVPAE
jgi:hypothetical protein